MNKAKKWPALVMIGAMTSILLLGCQKTEVNKEPTISSPTPTASQAASTEGIYNVAFESYNNVTELGAVVNEPTPEDLAHLKTLETYEYMDTNESLLIIPKYNGSKITVSTVEFTGERYIAKDVLWTKEATTEGYGLVVKTNRPEGIPQIVINVTYKNKSYDHLVMYNGKDGNNSVEYLKLETEASKEKEGDLIAPVQDATYLNGLNCFNRYDLDIDKDGKDETIEVYCDGEIAADGSYLFDDGQQWAMILRKGDQIYPLFEKSYINLGGLEYMAYIDYNDYEKVHIMVTYKTGAAVINYDCTFDEESGQILRNKIYEAGNISVLKSWR